MFVKYDLGLPAAAAGAVAAAVPTGRILGSYAAGRAVDSVGERTVLVVGAAATGALVVLAAAAPLAATLALFVVVGVFASTPTPAGGKLVLLRFASERRGFATGIRQSGVSIGGLLAALVLPPVAVAFGWRAALLAAGVLTLAGAALAMTLTGGVESRSERSALFAALRREPPAEGVHRNGDLLLITTWGVLLVAGHYVLIAFLPVYLFETGRVSLPAATLLVAVVQAGAIVGRLGWGAISDRVFGGRRRPALLLITVLATSSFLMLGALPSRAPLAAFGVAAFVGGLSVVGWQGIYVVSVGELAGALRAGTATGFSLTFISISIAAAPPLYGLVADTAGGFREAWLVLAAVVALAALPALIVREPSERELRRR